MSLIFCFVFLLNLANFINAQCTWNLNKDLPIPSPLYFGSRVISDLLMPDSTGLNLRDGQSMILLCPGKSNTIVGTGKQEITATCTSNNMLLYNGTPYSLNAFYCANRISSEISNGAACGNGFGEIMKLGFNTSFGFTVLITTCYNRIEETVLYSNNTIAKSIANAEVNSDRPGFKTQGLTYGTTSANMYKQTEQTKRFAQLLGQSQADKFITSSMYLARGHVSPDADFIFGSWSIASYFYVNVAPQWQSNNAGNWLRVENIARRITDIYNEDMTIISGEHGVLQLPNESGELIDIFLLDGGRLRVPKWYWKIIYSPATKKGIAFVTSNNPHVDYINESEYICKNVCAETLWNKPEWNIYGKGLTYCCDVNQLINTVGTMSPMNILGFITGDMAGL